MNFQRFLHTLAATQEVPRHTRLHSRGSTRVSPTSRGAPFPPPSSKESSFPCVVGKKSRRFRHISRGGALHRKGERNSRVCHHSHSPPDVSVHSRETCFPCTASTFQSRIDSHHGGTWDSTVDKTRGKATNPLIHSMGSMTLLLQPGRKAHVHAPTQDDD